MNTRDNSVNTKDDSESLELTPDELNHVSGGVVCITQPAEIHIDSFGTGGGGGGGKIIIQGS